MDPQKTPSNQPPEGEQPDVDPAAPESPLPEAPADDTPAQPESVEASSFDSDEQPPAGDPLAPTEESKPEGSLPPAPADSQDSGPVAMGDVTPNPLPVAAPKHRKKGLIAGLIIAAVLLLVSGGAAASYYYMLNKPENVLKQALANSLSLEKAATMQFNGLLSAEESGSGTPIEATFKGSADSKTGAFEFGGEVDLVLTTATFDMLSADGKSLFFRLGGLEGLPELLASSADEAAAYAPLVASLNDQWIEISDSLIKQYDKSFESGVLTEADAKKAADAYLEHPFLVVDEVLDDQTIAGAVCYHYRLKVDPAKLKSFFAALKDAKLDSYKIDQKALDTFNKSIDEAELQKYPFEIWISKDGKMIKQVEAEFVSEGTDFVFRFTADSYNKPVKVEEPEDAKSLLDIMGDFLSTGLGGSLTMPATEPDSGISL